MPADHCPGVTMTRACFNPDQSLRAKTRKSLANAASLGRGCFRFSAASCWRSARFSSRSVRRAGKSRRIPPNRRPIVSIIRWCYRISPVNRNAYAVEITGGRNFGEPQPQPGPCEAKKRFSTIRILLFTRKLELFRLVGFLVRFVQGRFQNSGKSKRVILKLGDQPS
jgi:hypothetical protein